MDIEEMKHQLYCRHWEAVMRYGVAKPGDEIMLIKESRPHIAGTFLTIAGVDGAESIITDGSRINVGHPNLVIERKTAEEWSALYRGARISERFRAEFHLESGGG